MRSPIGSLVYDTKPEAGPKHRDTMTVTLYTYAHSITLTKFTLCKIFDDVVV
jgi:hypothetical protein